MNATAPLLEIILALFLMVMPEGTKSFTITSPSVSPTPITWTLQDDGSWSGLSNDGQTAFGPWVYKDMKLIRVRKERTPENVLDVAQWIAKDESGFLIEGSRLKIGKTAEGVWLVATEGGPFTEPVRIETNK